LKKPQHRKLKGIWLRIINGLLNFIRGQDE